MPCRGHPGSRIRAVPRIPLGLPYFPLSAKHCQSRSENDADHDDPDHALVEWAATESEDMLPMALHERLRRARLHLARSCALLGQDSRRPKMLGMAWQKMVTCPVESRLTKDGLMAWAHARGLDFVATTAVTLRSGRVELGWTDTISKKTDGKAKLVVAADEVSRFGGLLAHQSSQQGKKAFRQVSGQQGIRTYFGSAAPDSNLAVAAAAAPATDSENNIQTSAPSTPSRNRSPEFAAFSPVKRKLAARVSSDASSPRPKRRWQAGILQHPKIAGL